MESPPYQLAPKARLEITQQGAWLICNSPLVASKLNASAVQLLARVLHCEKPEQWSQDETAFLAGLVDQGWLEINPPLPSALPRVSVVVPVRNRPQEIKTCLETILSLDYPSDRLEVIVVDDASSDETPDVVRRFPVRLIVSPRQQGASSSRNLGALNASGDIVAFTDSDCRVSKTWLQELIPFLSLPGCVAVGGRVLPTFEAAARDRYAAAYSALDMGLRTRRVAPGTSVFYVPSCNLLIQREALQRASGFDPGFPIGEDIDLEYRLMKQGGTVWYAACGGVYHAHRTEMIKRWRRELDYAASEGYLQRRHQELRKVWRLPPEAIPLAGIVVGAILSREFLWLVLLPLWLVVQVIVRWCRLRSMPVPVSLSRLFMSTLLAYWWHVHSVAWLVLRYYLILCAALILLFPSFWLPLALLLFLAPISEYTRTKPAVPLLLFIPLYLLDGLVYHLGILQAVVRQRTLWPIRTRLTI